jgi:hypothetical protein
MTSQGRLRLLSALLLMLSLFADPAARAQDANEAKRLELGQQLIDLAGAKNSIAQMLDQIAPGLTQLVQQANPGKEKEVAEVMNQFIVPKMKENLPEALRECAVVYANHFSEEELQQLIAFYQSPLGRKLVQEQPAMSQELARFGTTWAQNAALQAIREYANEFKKRGLDTPI